MCRPARVAGRSTRRLGFVLTVATSSNDIVVTMQAITLTIRAIGNSKGIVLPKPVLAQIGSKARRTSR